MSLKTYDRPTNIEDGSFRPWSFVLVEGQGDPNCDVLTPGDWITHKLWGGYGVVIAVSESQLTVLWSTDPDMDLEQWFKPIKQKTINLAKDLVEVQPMTAPSGLIFYLDHVYGKKECDEAGPDATPEEGPTTD